MSGFWTMLVNVCQKPNFEPPEHLVSPKKNWSSNLANLEKMFGPSLMYTNLMMRDNFGWHSTTNGNCNQMYLTLLNIESTILPQNSTWRKKSGLTCIHYTFSALLTATRNASRLLCVCRNIYYFPHLLPTILPSAKNRKNSAKIKSDVNHILITDRREPQPKPNFEPLSLQLNFEPQKKKLHPKHVRVLGLSLVVAMIEDQRHFPKFREISRNFCEIQE